MANPPRRIVIWHVGLFGEILMATPILPALRAAWPDARIIWAVDPTYREAIETNPYVDEILLWDTPQLRLLLRKRRLLAWLRLSQRLINAIQACEPDIFISFLPEKWGALARRCGAPTRIGVFDTHRAFFQQAHTSKNARFYTHAFTQKELPAHRTEMYLLPLKALGLPTPADRTMQLERTSADDARVAAFLAEHALDVSTPLVAFAPTTTWESRNWPVERYIALGRALVESHPERRIVVVGRDTPGERAILDPIVAGLGAAAVPAIGVLGFRQLAALIAHCRLLVSGDTGPMHVAAAVGTPYLALFGPTPAAGRAPLSGRGTALQVTVPCGPCDQPKCANTGDDNLRCLKELSVAQALAAAQALLG